MCWTGKVLILLYRSGLVTEADWQSWKKEDFQPYIDVNGNCFLP